MAAGRAPSEAATGQKRPLKVLLLQGPVGPFFRQLHKRLVARGDIAKRITFNAADALFARSADCTRFSGNEADWDLWLHLELSQNRPDVIVLFGSNRPAHRIARRVAGMLDVPVISLEEGYLRSGFITCESGGNNQSSPMVHWVPHRPVELVGAERPAPAAASFPSMSVWGTIYYLVRDLLSDPSADALFHRPRERGLVLAATWAVHMLRRAMARIVEAPQRRRLKDDSGYILVPLQVPSDSQLTVAARGWTSERLIDACLSALLHSGSGQTLVIKLHPLDRGGAALRRTIRRRARNLGLSDRVVVLHAGRIGELASRAAGMIVINSTSAFSALHCGVPVLVLGDAVFRHEDVVTPGVSETDVATFFKVRQAKSRDIINAFLADLKANSLIPGDFYAAAGIKIAVGGVMAKITAEAAIARRMTGAAE
jgi:capsular polysaccharide export protein